jgi:hypothetical protein
MYAAVVTRRVSFPQAIGRSISGMYRGVATALVALAAIDYFYLDGKYLHYVQAVANSMLHFLMP